MFNGSRDRFFSSRPRHWRRWILPVAVVGMCVFPTPNAHAYIDAATGSLILQLTIGAFLGAMLTAKLWWVKLKLLSGRLFGRAKKDAESGK